MLGGGEHSFFDLLSNLSPQWRVLAVVPGEGELAARLKENAVETRILALPAIRPWNVVQMLAALKAYLLLLRDFRPSLIYANGSRVALYGGLLGRILRIPTIWHCRVAQGDPYLDPFLVRLSTGIVANSQATARRFSPRFQTKVSMIHNGVDINWLRDKNVRLPDMIQEEWKVILTVARVSKWKRHDLVLSAFEQVAASEPLAHLVFLGAKDVSEPGWWEYLQEMTRRSPFSPRVHWLGQVKDVRSWYRVADMMVLASENEPFGRVIVEAMACGVSVVACRSGGVPEVVRDGLDGLLASPGSDHEIAEAMIKILNDHNFSEQLARSAIERAELFSLDSHVAKMMQIFENSLIR